MLLNVHRNGPSVVPVLFKVHPCNCSCVFAVLQCRITLTPVTSSLGAKQQQQQQTNKPGLALHQQYQLYSDEAISVFEMISILHLRKSLRLGSWTLQATFVAANLPKN